MSADVILPQTGYPTMRRWPRYKVDVPVRVITQGASKVAIVTGRGSELNLGGMTVFAGTELAMGAEWQSNSRHLIPAIRSVSAAW